MNVLDLFSGIGGFSLGLERAGMRTVAFCEISPYCRAVLRKHWPNIPIFEDIRELEPMAVDVICGGFPCQDVSQAGARVGIDGERSGLWYEYARLIRDIRPSFAIVENVSGLLDRGLGDVLGSLAEIGYDAEWHCIPAWYVGAPQARERVWIIAYPHGSRRARRSQPDGCEEPPIFCPRGDYDERLGVAQSSVKEATALGKCRVDDGVRNRLDRVRALGNSIVPQVAEAIGHAIMNSLPTHPDYGTPNWCPVCSPKNLGYCRCEIASNE